VFHQKSHFFILKRTALTCFSFKVHGIGKLLDLL